ncbi:hypothetical protein BKI52_21435 [marine bacterium AO1-C]|nr:hypothetical protein BKI52_21435 [marine bacterium AO1-C]
MMKKILYLSILLALVVATQAVAQDTYYILAVKGQILNNSTKKPLKARQKIKASDKVVFKSKSAQALIFSRGKGRFVLRLNPKQKSSNEFIALVKKSIFSQKSGAYTRISYASTKQMREDILEGNPHYLILGDRWEVAVVQSFINEVSTWGDGFFFIRYRYEGKTRNIALSLKDFKIIITKEALFKTKEGQWLDPSKATDMHIAYYVKSGDNKGIIQIGDKDGNSQLAFNPLFVPYKEINMDDIVANLKTKTSDKREIIRDITQILANFYGRADSDNVAVWYNKTFK